MAAACDSLFTVVIPTKDRADYLYHTLRTCSLQEDDRFEVVVADDGSTDHTREVVAEAARKDPRIRYATPGTGVGMRDNFEFALDQVKPGFVMALGGDDGLLPHGISGMREVLAETGQEMLAWPAPIFAYPKARTPTGQLIVHRRSARRIIQSREFLARQARELNYLADVESPMCYVKGVTSTRLVAQVRARTPGGRFYACATPDGYSGIVLAGEVESYAFSGEPFSLYGASPASQGLAYLAKDEKAKQQSEAFYRDVVANPMHPELGSQPYSPLISLMTADYLLTARDLPGWPGTFPAIDPRQLLAKSLAEISHGLYAEERLARELTILDGIAEHHGLGQVFREMVRQARRRKTVTPFAGNGANPSQWFLDATQFGIRDVFDAAYVAYAITRMAPQANLRTLWGALTNSLGYLWRSRRPGGPFPDPSLWHKPATTPN